MKLTHLRLAIALLALPLVGLHVVLKQQPEAREVDQLRSAVSRPGEWQGKLAPDFELSLLDGSRFHLADHVGREVVVLNFFATWCGPCKAEMPELGRFVERRRGQPFLLIGIDAEEKEDLVKAFLRDLPVPFPVGIDASGELQKSFGVEAYPTTIAIGSDGRIQLYQSGAILNADVALGALVDSSVEQIRHGGGIPRDAYREALKAERYPTPAPRRDQPRLGERARRIAGAMDCPCGCSDTLLKCACSTARKAKAKLASLSLEGRHDADVMEELNREFCMKGME